MDANHCEPTGNGGNGTLINQDEQQILNRTAEHANTLARTEGAQEGEFH
ncbi:hypothetical protein [Streptomyces sp. URMC 129]